jgi:endonuclease/exonuclease/phosphatase family metal-dependent hydrolase
MVLLVLFILGYYAVYQISLPYDNSMLLMLAAVLVAGGAMTSLRYARVRLRVSPQQWQAAALACLIALLPPLLLVLNAPTPQTADDGFPLRVLSYNLHNGFNARDRLDLEGLARQIEKSGADVVALQEVSRGWLVSGRADMLEWLSHRLGMSYYFGPTAGPFWGNAVLSRYPIVAAASIKLPSEGLPIKRGFILALIEVGGQNIRVIDVHLHHVEADSDIRVGQVAALIDYYGFTGRTIIMGDFNAEPDSPEIVFMRGFGLKDVLSSIEPPPAYTYPSEDPYQRIDYIWVSPDLKYSDVSLLTGTASDHFGVMVTIGE